MEQRSAYTVRDLLHVLFKRKWLIGIFFLSTVATVGTVTFVLEQPAYEATAQILLRAGREHLSDVGLPNANATATPPRLSFDLEEQAARTIELLTGRYLAEQVVQKVGVRRLCLAASDRLFASLNDSYCPPGLSEQMLFERMVAQLQSNIRAQRLGSAALVSLSFRHEDPTVAADVVNTLSTLYLERYLGVLKNPRTEAFLQEQFGEAKERAAQVEKELESFKARNGISSTVKEEHELAMKELSAQQALLSETISREADITSRIAQLKDVLAKHGTLNQRVQDELLHTDTDLKGIRARRSSQEAKVAELQRKVKRLDSLEPEFDRIQQRFEIERQNYRMYMTKSEETRISNAMDAEKIASFKIIEPARTPTQPLKSKLTLKLALALFFGALGGLIVAFGLEFFSDRLETAERVEAVLEAPVLVSIPRLRLK